MIDVCLINPRTETQTSIDERNKTAMFQEGVIKSTEKQIREPPNGILILAAILENRGYSVEIVDCSILLNPEEKIKEIAPKSRVIGITSLTNTINMAKSLAKIAFRENPDLFLIFGGPHVSFRYKILLEKNPFIDFVCVGETEESFPWLVQEILGEPAIERYYQGISLNSEKKEILREIKKNQDYKIPNGIAYLQDKAVHYTGKPEPTDIEELPQPARHLLHQKYTVANVLINRGCSFQCSFCSRSKLFPKTRLRSLQNVLNEVDQILSFSNYKVINFYDNINLNPTYFRRFLNALKSKPNMLPWGAELRADIITEEDANLMKQAHCKGIATGVESANEKVLKINGKAQRIAEERKGIVNLKKAGIAVQLFFIIGLPGETKETFSETLQFIRNLPLNPNKDKLEFFLPTPYPGADFVEHQEKYGIHILHHNYDIYNCREIILETETLSKSEIEDLLNQARKLEKMMGFK